VRAIDEIGHFQPKGTPTNATDELPEYPGIDQLVDIGDEQDSIIGFAAHSICDGISLCPFAFPVLVSGPTGKALIASRKRDVVGFNAIGDVLSRRSRLTLIGQITFDEDMSIDASAKKFQARSEHPLLVVVKKRVDDAGHRA
jgi:hypothetical protein